MTKQQSLRSMIDVALGREKADFVFKNGYFLDVFNGRFLAGDVAIAQGKIIGILDQYHGRQEIDLAGAYMVPGFIDAHTHIESSLLAPEQYQQLVLSKGTTSVIWDPHEIANVAGMEGLQWALSAIENLCLDVFVMLPSCVPATNPALEFETSGAILFANDLKLFAQYPRVLGLAELMNLPGLFAHDPDVLEKILLFSNAKIDGHCPSIRSHELNACKSVGIHSCHESTSFEEAQEKLTKGIHVLIREGSCERNADTLLPLLNAYTSSMIAFCSDDLKPNDIVKDGHIDFIINKALRRNIAPEVVFRAASLTPAGLYGLKNRGAIAAGYCADLCVIRPREDNWQNGMQIEKVYKNGRLIQENRLSCIQNTPFSVKHNMNLEDCSADQFQIRACSRDADTQRVPVIGIIPDQILTEKLMLDLPVKNGEIQVDLSKDILKIAVFDRHHRSGFYTVWFVKGFGLKEGAMASTVAHDSHNLIVVGADDECMARAVNQLIQENGGLSAVNGAGEAVSLALPLGGLMTHENTDQVLKKIEQLKQFIHQMGCPLKEPFLTLAFLALPVIPSLKITDRGLIDVERFEKVDLSG